MFNSDDLQVIKVSKTVVLKFLSCNSFVVHGLVLPVINVFHFFIFKISMNAPKEPPFVH